MTKNKMKKIETIKHENETEEVYEIQELKDATKLQECNKMTFALGTPLKKGNVYINKLATRKPKIGDLIGLSTEDIINGDVITSVKLLSRITEPLLTKAEINSLSPADFFNIMGLTKLFFINKKSGEMPKTL